MNVLLTSITIGAMALLPSLALAQPLPQPKPIGPGGLVMKLGTSRTITISLSGTYDR